MANLLFKRNNNQGVAPSVSELELGELALNTYDGTIYTKVDRQGVQSIVAIPNGDGAYQTGVLYVSKNGDDTNSGKTPGTAKQTLTAAVAVATENVFAPTNPAPAGYSSAIALLKANRTYLQNEATAYVDSVYSSLTYDEDKCRRDTGLILDAVGYDIALGTNFNSVTAGLAYQRASSAYVLSDQLNQTTGAIAYTKSLVLDLDAVTTDSTATYIAGQSFDEIIDIISNGTAAADTLNFPSTPHTTSNMEKVIVQIQNNIEFLQAEVLEYVRVNYLSVYNNMGADGRAKCSRDVKYILDALCYDLAYGGNSASVQAANSYFLGTQSQLGTGEATATAAAYDYLSTALEYVIAETNGAGFPLQSSVFQNTDGEPVLGGVEAAQAADLLQIIEDVITAGTVSGMPATTYPDLTGIRTELTDARTAIDNSRQAFIDDTIEYINANFSDLTYNKDKCFRDVGLIVDAITTDLRFGGNEEAIYAARSYLTYLGNNLGAGETNATIASLNYIKSISRSIIQNSTVVSGYQNDITQTIDNTLTGGVAADARMIELYDTITNGIQNGEDDLAALEINNIVITPHTIRIAAGDYIETNPIALPPYTSIVGDSLRAVSVSGTTATEDIFHVTQANYLSDMTFKGHLAPAASIAFSPSGNTFLQRDVQSWTSPYIQNCTSRTTTGTGMRVDGSVAGGLRSMVVDSFTQYNEGGIGVHLLNRGYAQLVSVFTICCQDAFLAESGGFCSITNSNSSFGTYGLRSTGVSEEMYAGAVALAGGAANQSTVEVDGLLIRPNEGDAVKFAGDDTYYTVASATSLFTTTNAGNYNHASALLTVNKAYIADEIVDWVNTTYPGLIYDADKCERDVELIVAAIAADLVDGGVENTDRAARLYWAGTQSQVIGQLDETAAAVGQIASVAAQVLAQTASGMVTQSSLTAEAGSSTVVANLVTDIQHTILRDTTGKSVITLEENLATTKTNNTQVGFHQRSLIGASAHTFEYVGTGNSMEQAVPYLGGRGIQENEVVEDANGAGKVNFTSTDQKGDFRIGQELVIERATGTITGRTFNRSLFAVMTPYILAITD